MSGIACEQSSLPSATGEPDVPGYAHDAPMTADAAPSPELIEARRRLAELVREARATIAKWDNTVQPKN